MTRAETLTQLLALPNEPCLTPIQIVSLYETPDGGWSFLVRGKKQEVEIRATPSGLLRVGKVKKIGRNTSSGWK